MTVGKVRPALALVCILATTVPIPVEAAFTASQSKCAATIAKAGFGFVRSKLKLHQRCRNANLANPGSCSAPDAAALARIDETLRKTLQTKCTLASEGLGGIGFPAACTDDNAGDGFTANDLATCLRTSHDAIVAKLLTLQFDESVTGPVTKTQLACQMEVAKQSAGLVGCVLKSVQKCRVAVMRGKLPMVPADLCAIADEKTAATIAKCELKLTEGIQGRCSDGDVAALDVCTPDATTAVAAGQCLVNTQSALIDGPAIDVPPDLIDFQFAVRGGLCGDGIVDNLAEECDGDDDAACPGACGTTLEPDGYFACLCTTIPRIRVVEHGDSDTDNGWTGASADTGVAEGAGYVTDLYDCDASGLCNVGPSCSLPPHSPCSVYLAAPSGLTGNDVCAALGEGTCRKRRTATGPHCFQDIQKKCDPNNRADPVCNALGDFCTVTPSSPPNPVSSGGVSVCNMTIWSEDVVGTVNLTSGESVVRAPQRSRTYSRMVGSANKPCPVCGGFCAVSRERCASDDDCAAGKGPCITAPVCSDGSNAGKGCRTAPPFGNPTVTFGTTSIDCPPDPLGEITSKDGLDLYVTARSTGGVSMLPTQPCMAPGFSGNACVGGSSGGRSCTGASECPGGTCAPQCFCAGQLQPNDCDDACVGGPNDASECHTHSECPGGFCHVGDCRADPGDPDSTQEGVCTSGPSQGWCSITTYRPCTSAAECTQAACSYCSPGESCISENRACFVNGGITREGLPRTPEGRSVGIYCIEGDKEAVNIVAGFPGPAAFTQPELQIVVP